MDSKNLISMISVVLAVILVTATYSISAEAGDLGPTMKFRQNSATIGPYEPQVRVFEPQVRVFEPQYRVFEPQYRVYEPQYRPDVGQLSIRKPVAYSGSVKASSKVDPLTWLIKLILPYWHPDLSIITRPGADE